MKRVRTSIAATLCLFVLLASGSTSGKETTDGKIVILFTHDLHSYFLPQPLTRSAAGPTTRGGYARLATLVTENRNTYKDRVILVDAGDFSMGTLFHTSFEKDALELRLMAQMGYDVVTIGNHDLDFHINGLAGTLNEARKRSARVPAMVASNIVFGPPCPEDEQLREAFRTYPVKGYVVLQRNGLRIGIFGILGKDAQSDTPFAAPLTFADPIVAGKRMVDALRNKEKVDLIVCLSHSGTSPDKSHSEDEILAEKVPGIDIIVSGHTHTVLPKPIAIGKTLIVASGCYGAYLGVLEISHDKGRGTKLVSYALSEVSENVQGNPKLTGVIETFKSDVNRAYLAAYGVSFDQVIGESTFDMESLEEVYRHPGETGLGNMVTDAYRYAIEKAEGPRYDYVHMVIEPLGHIRSSLFRGKITVSDLFRVLSLGLGTDGTPGYPLLTVYLTGKEVKRLLEVETTVAPFKEDAHLQLSGVRCKFNPHRIPFDRVTSVSVRDRDGVYRTLDSSRLYRVGMNYYTAIMLGYVSRISHGLLSIVPKDGEGRPLKDIKQAIVPAGSFNTHVREIKEWAALAVYIGSFPDTDGNGIPNVPDRYMAREGRVAPQPSWNPIGLVSGATWITYGAVTAFCAVVLIVVPLVCVAVRLIR